MLALGGLNKTKILIKVVQNIMKDCGIREEVREEPNTDGPLVIWDDSFLRCFIKRVENSVWILRVVVVGNRDDKRMANDWDV